MNYIVDISGEIPKACRVIKVERYILNAQTTIVFSEARISTRTDNIIASIKQGINNVGAYKARSTHDKASLGQTGLLPHSQFATDFPSQFG